MPWQVQLFPCEVYDHVHSFLLPSIYIYRTRRSKDRHHAITIQIEMTLVKRYTLWPTMVVQKRIWWSKWQQEEEEEEENEKECGEEKEFCFLKNVLANLGILNSPPPGIIFFFFYFNVE